MNLSDAIRLIREEFKRCVDTDGYSRPVGADMFARASAMDIFDRAAAAAVMRWNEPSQLAKILAEDEITGARYEKADIARLVDMAKKVGVPYPFLAERIANYKGRRMRMQRIDAILEASK